MDSNTIETNEKYSELIVERLDQLIAATLDTQSRPQLSLDITLWDTRNIADYLGRAYKYTNEYIVTHHTFPNAIRISIKDGKKSHPRWYAGEVIEWVAQNKEK